MPLPSDVGTFTLVGGQPNGYTDAAGNIAEAGVQGVIVPVGANGVPTQVTHVSDGATIVPEQVPFTIGSDGKWSVPGLAHTDDPNLSPVGFLYRVTFKPAYRSTLVGKTIAVPTAAGATANYDLLQPSTDAPGILVPVATGPQGPAGESAYALAVEQGFAGTEAEWLASLVGAQGPQGPAGPVASVVGLTGDVTGADIAADPALRAAFGTAVDEDDFTPTGAWDWTGATVIGLDGGGIASTGSEVWTGPGGTVHANAGTALSIGDPSGVFDVFSATLNDDVMITLPAPVRGSRFRLRLVQDATGGRTVTLASASGSVVYPVGEPVIVGGGTAINELLCYATNAAWEVLPLTDGTIQAKGDLVVGTAAGAVDRRPVGTDGQVLTADSSEPDGVVWGDPVVGAASHVGMFGDGGDGAATLDGAASVAWATRSGSTYTMTADANCTDLTINSGVTLVTAGFRIKCTGTLTNNGTISGAGRPASGGTAGAGWPGGTLPGSGSGGGGTTGAGSAGLAGTMGGRGGNGGAGASGAAGNGGNPAVAMTTTIMRTLFAQPIPVATGQVWYGTANRNLNGGAGGGAGGGDGANPGGGGGGGATIVAIFAHTLINSGTLTAAGGAGGSQASGNVGGGGGGGGAPILVYTAIAATMGTVDVSGGAGGAAAGTGSPGLVGQISFALNIVLQ